MQTIIERLPTHLKKYIVSQNYEKYTAEDQAVWRYIMKQLKNFLRQNAHSCYLDGLEKTGITTHRIPHIEEISAKLSEFGWGAVPVSGFIPPAAFMEFQSLGVLPIASDMRSIDHILYTPAPDIVHEAAGHAPILIDTEFANYLKKYADIARQSIISKQDMDLYEAIRVLSDVKENPESTQQEVSDAEKNLEKVSAEINDISEAGLLSRMNWWTAEYGLIGDLKDPKIFGAGLLSSLGEARECLKDKVTKIPLTIDCIRTGYDITEPQPQLFVTPDFENLHQVLEDLADQMAFRRGGVYGLEKAKSAQTVNTLQLDTGLQISGIVERFEVNAQGDVVFVKCSGASQLSVHGQQLKGHGPDYHAHGYSTPLGKFNGWDGDISSLNLPKLGIEFGKTATLKFESGIELTGQLTNVYDFNKSPVILTFENCKIQFNEETLFDPSWGLFDLALGTSIPSVFGGPADRVHYEGGEDFVAARVPERKLSDEDKKIFQLYQKISDALQSTNQIDEKTIQNLILEWESIGDDNWLIALELIELLNSYPSSEKMIERIQQQVIAQVTEEQLTRFQDGLKLNSSL